MYFLLFVPSTYLNSFFFLCGIPIRRFHLLYQRRIPYVLQVFWSCGKHFQQLIHTISSELVTCVYPGSALVSCGLVAAVSWNKDTLYTQVPAKTLC